MSHHNVVPEDGHYTKGSIMSDEVSQKILNWRTKRIVGAPEVKGIKFLSYAHYQNRHKKKAQYLRNKQARADLNREWGRKGHLGTAMVGTYHTAIKALSMGTYGS